MTKRDLSRNTLFDVMLVLQNIDSQRSEIPGLELAPYHYESDTSKFDLTLTAAESGDRFVFSIAYSTKLFKQDTIQRFVNYFKRLTTAFLEDSQQSISWLDLISEQEKQQILIDFNATDLDYPASRTIHQLFEIQVEETPNHIALTGENSKAPVQDIPIAIRNSKHHLNHLTYRELNNRSNQLAKMLKEKGLKSGGIVALMAGRTIDTVIGILGILKAGGAYLPIDPGYPEERVNYMLRDSAAKVIVTNSLVIDRLDGSMVIKPGDANKLPNRQTNKPTNQQTNLAYIIYTSGTTGKPKGVMIDHRGVVNLVSALKEEVFRYNKPVNVSLISPYVFDASVKQVFPTLLLGHTLNIVPEETRLDAEKLLSFYKERNIRISDGTPAHLDIILNVKEQLEHRLPVEFFVIGGEELKQDLCTRFFNVVDNRQLKILNVYGPTECCDVTTSFTVTRDLSRRHRVPIGKPLGNKKTYILSPGGRLQPIGLTGELCIGGIGTGKGYLNSPELTKTKFVDNPFEEGETLYRSGDLARWLADGNIEFLGRIDHQVKIRGYRIELPGIENRLLTHEGVKEAAVIQREYSSGDKYLCAYVVPVKGDIVPDPSSPIEAHFDGTQLRGHLSASLPDYMIPSYFVTIKAIPLTANGKLNRSLLPEPETLTPAAEYAAPRDKLEETLAKLWLEVLGLSAENRLPGIDDDFFRLGGHSLNAIMLVSKIHKHLDITVSLTDIFRFFTIRDLALRLKGGKSPEKDRYTAIEPMEEKEYYPLSSAQQRLFFIHRLSEADTVYNVPWLMELDGDIEIPKLETAFIGLIDRHESLRTSFEVIDDEGVQRIHKDLSFRIEYFSPDLETGDVVNDFIRPFDLAHAPLMMVGLFSLEVRRYLLMMDMHHIISDAV
ncbi:MAG: amino acid adenylation domain-containing protein, partial [bacterium]|nr:amino acid adenylation domain-containing protein [bacterium]